MRNQKKSNSPPQSTPTPQIIIDHRENKSLVSIYLQKQDINFKFKQLQVGDFIINQTIIERKTIADLAQSIFNKRIFKQLNDLRQFENRLLIIEGLNTDKLYKNKTISNINTNAIRGFILSTQLKYKIPIITTKDECDTAKTIELIIKKEQKSSTPKQLNPKSTPKNPHNQIQFILEAFPNIGPATAQKLLTKFKNLKTIFTTDQENLEKEIGRPAQVFDILNYNWKPKMQVAKTKK